MAIYTWSLLSHEDLLVFDPDADTLVMDDGLKAVEVEVTFGAGMISFFYDGKEITLLTAGDTLTTNNVIFLDDSLLVIGDNTTGATDDGTANVLYGDFEDDLLIGLGGDDTLDGGSGADIMTGGAGDDIYMVDDDRDVIIEEADGGVDTALAWASYTLPEHVENLVLMGSNDLNGTGNESNNMLQGNDGANVLDGAGGVDIFAGGMGNDTYIVDNPGDQVMELANSGIDTVISSVSYDLMQAWHVENLELTGEGAIKGSGNWLANRITGNGAANLLEGKRGNDTLSGGGGADTLDGGDGDDVLVWDAADASVDGGAGTDTLLLDGSGVTLDLTLFSGSVIKGMEVIDLGEGANTLRLGVADVLALSPTTDTLRVDGGPSYQFDLVDAPDWTYHGIGLQIGYAEYGRYTNGMATLFLQEHVQI